MLWHVPKESIKYTINIFHQYTAAKRFIKLVHNQTGCCCLIMLLLLLQY